MTRRRLLPTALVAIVLVVIPVKTEADAAFGVTLSTASCAEGGCGPLSLADCFCPDMQFPNLRPQCDE